MNHILISQIKNIGDVVLCLPIVGLLKEHDPHCKITLLARQYTKPVAQACKNIDDFVDWDELKSLPDAQAIERLKQLNATTIIHVATDQHIARLAKKAGIPTRIGTLQRIYHWFYCNKMINQSRRNSTLHEVQLNAKLLKPLGITNQLPYQQLAPYIALQLHDSLPPEIATQKEPERFNLIIHPGSHGHGREWPQTHFQQLIQRLPAERFKIFLTGTAQEQERFEPLLSACPQICNMMGLMNLTQLMCFISQADGLIASGTGPLHLGAALGIKTVGLFPPRKGINPRRWAPVGKQAQALVYQRMGNKPCFGCRDSLGCKCMAQISVSEVLNIVLAWQCDMLDVSLYPSPTAVGEGDLFKKSRTTLSFTLQETQSGAPPSEEKGKCKLAKNFC